MSLVAARKPTPKERVLRRYPDAFCETNGPYYQVVVPLPYGRVRRLSITQRNRRAAWYLAAGAVAAEEAIDA